MVRAFSLAHTLNYGGISEILNSAWLFVSKSCKRKEIPFPSSTRSIALRVELGEMYRYLFKSGAFGEHLGSWTLETDLE